MTDEEIVQFWKYVREYTDLGHRTGQAMMNALNRVSYILYDMVAGTKYDVFYKNTSQDIYRFREYLGI